MVDEVSNGDYYASNSNKSRNKDHLSAQILTVMICEKYVHVPRQQNQCCLIHYLCTYPSMRERGYASMLMKRVYSQGEMVNKKIYCVTVLPKRFTRRRGNSLNEDLDSNDVWSSIASRRRMSPFFEKKPVQLGVHSFLIPFTTMSFSLL